MTVNEPDAETVFRRFRRACLPQFSAWRDNEGVALGFTAKALLASALALWLGFRLDLENPRWSVVSIFIVMQPESGLVLEKGFYRLLATLIGCVVSVAMVAAFAQEPEVFLGVLAVWLGVCVACSLRFRHYQAYAWALAGYTVTIVGLPAGFSNPDGVFTAAVARATEISIGVACAGLVGALVFPRTSTSRLRVQARERFADFTSHALTLFKGDELVADADARRRLFDGLAAQDTAMSAAAFENPHHPDAVIRIRRLNRGFVRLSTRIHLLLHLRRRLRARGDVTLTDTIELQSSFMPGPGAASSPERLSAALRTARGRLLRLVPSRTSGGPASEPETHARILGGFMEDLAAHAEVYARLDEPLPADDPGEPPYATSRVDGLLAALVGARAALTVALLSCFWIGTEWPDGVTAIMCAMIAYALCAAAPRPVAMMKEALAAFLLAVPAGFVFRFYLMSEAHDFVWLFAAIAPFLAFSAYLIARPKGFLTGLFFSVWFLTLAGPENNPAPDLSTFFGQSLAGALGIGSALVLTALVLPNGSRWVRRRERLELRRLVVDACLDAEAGFGARFDHESRALLRRIAGNRSAGAGDGEEGRVMRWSYAALEIGGAMIGLRESLAGAEPPPGVKIAADRVAKAVSDVFRSPSEISRRAAVDAVDDASAVFAAEEIPAASDYLHLLRAALLDPDSPLAEDTDAGFLENRFFHA